MELSRWRVQTACPPGHTGRAMQIRVGCEFVYQAEVATHAVIQVEPRLDGAVRALDEQGQHAPAGRVSALRDGFGQRFAAATLPLGPSSLRYDALLQVPDEPDPSVSMRSSRSPARIFRTRRWFSRWPAPLPDPGPRRRGSVRLFWPIPPGWRRVQAISDCAQRDQFGVSPDRAVRADGGRRSWEPGWRVPGLASPGGDPSAGR